MADISPLPFSLSDDNPAFTAAASSSSPGADFDDGFEDACSICLDPFTSQNPSTVTICKHEYHLQCILEWSQRSKECPICWQLLALNDPTSQELLAAVETEKRSRSRNTSPVAFTNFPYFHEGFDLEQDSYSDDSDIDERMMQHLDAVSSRAHYVHRRNRQRLSGFRSSHLLVFSSLENVPSVQQTSGNNSPISGIPSVFPPVVDVDSSTAANEDGPFKPRIVFGQQPTEAPQGPSSSETSSFSDSIKSKWFAASARYKESISKSTTSIKEKLLARNNSVKELSKGVQREMSAGIAGVARMIERLDLTSKRTGASSTISVFTGRTTSISLKGKGVEENTIAHNLGQKSEEVAHDSGFSAPPNISSNVPDQLEVPILKGGH